MNSSILTTFLNWSVFFVAVVFIIFLLQHSIKRRMNKHKKLMKFRAHIKEKSKAEQKVRMDLANFHIQSEAEQYDSLPFYKTSHGQSAIITLLFIYPIFYYSRLYPENFLLTTIALLLVFILALGMTRGYRWSFVVAAVLWTIIVAVSFILGFYDPEGVLLVKHTFLHAGIWIIYVALLNKAFRVEQIRNKSKKKK